MYVYIYIYICLFTNGYLIFFKQLDDNVKVKMFSDDSSHSETEFYYPDDG